MKEQTVKAIEGFKETPLTLDQIQKYRDNINKHLIRSCAMPINHDNKIIKIKVEVNDC